MTQKSHAYNQRQYEQRKKEKGYVYLCRWVKKEHVETVENLIKSLKNKEKASQYPTSG